jgi:hypothetical protein
LQRAAGLTQLSAARSVAEAARKAIAMLYAYQFVSLRDASPGTAAAFAGYVAGRGREAARHAGGELLGLFLPQLGFASHERALLVRWRGEPADVLGACAQVAGCVTDRLRATARPGETDRLAPGGIVVHRWFVIDPADEAEFVALSESAWVGFEGGFDSQIFGLFAAEPRPEDGASRRMLLVTRYGGHADWEASRRPGAETAGKFARRHQLTRSTRGCSTLLAPLD